MGTYTMPLITDETQILFNHQEQLAYKNLSNSDSEIELFLNDESVGILEIWTDAHLNHRAYVLINNEVMYLDTIRHRD